MRKFLIIALFLSGCSAHKAITPVPPTPVVTPPIVTPNPPIPPVITPTPPVVPPVSATPTSSISQDEYKSVPKSGITFVALQTLLHGKIAPQEIPQPGGGRNMRFPLLETDELYHGAHANFVFGVNGLLIRKSKS